MKLTIGERIRVGELLPKESDFTTLKILRELELRLSFSEEEIKKYKIVTNYATMNTFWDPLEASREFEIKMGEIVTKIITDKLVLLEKEKKLTRADYTLYKKFVENKK